MGELLVPLLAVMLVLIRQEPPGTWAAVDAPSALVALGVYLAFCWGGTALAVRRHLLQAPPEAPFSLPPIHRLLQLGALAAFLYRTDWVPLAGLLVGGLPFLDVVLGIAPLFAMHLGRGVITHRAERRRPESRWSLKDYLVFHQRVMALPVVPLILLAGLRRCLLDQGAFGRYVTSYVPLMVAFSLVTVTFVFALAPLLVRFVLGARPLSPGPLRDRLEAYGARTGFRPNDILVWNTGGGITNALYVGIVPRLRYVVITDALIESLDPPEVEAVYAHEAGHGVKLHTQLYLVLITGFMLLSVGTMDWVEGLVEDLARLGSTLGAVGMLLPQLAALFFGLGALLLFLVFVFGWLSRRFETEADLHAVQTLGEPEAIGRALESIGLHMGVLGRRGGMRHFGIGRRLGLINRFRHEAEFRQGFVTLLRRCRLGILAFVLLGAGLIAAKLPRFLDEGDVTLARTLYAEARDGGDLATLREAADRAREHVGPGRVGRFAAEVNLASLSSLADRHLRAGEDARARAVLAEMEALPVDPGPLGQFNRELLRVSLAVLDGTIGPDAVATLRADLDRLAARVPLDAGSLAETQGELYLLARATGAPPETPATVTGWPAEARLLLWWEDDARSETVRRELDAGLGEASEASVFRRRLLERITGRSVASLR